MRHRVTPTAIPVREQLRRDRAAAQTLRIVFPLVGQLRIDLVFEEPAGMPPARQIHVLHPSARAFFEFPCPYAACEGKFDLSGFARRSAEHIGSHVAGRLECGGTRAKGPATRSPCGLILAYDIAAANLMPTVLAARR